MDESTAAIFVAVIAALASILTTWLAHRNRRTVKDTQEQIATSNGQTIGQLVEQIAKRVDAQRSDLNDAKGELQTLIEMQRDTWEGLIGHLRDHIRDETRHVDRREENDEATS